MGSLAISSGHSLGMRDRPLTMWRFLCACVVLGTVVLQAAAQTSLTEEDRQELLDVHNDLRGMVNPPARNMLRMVSCAPL